MLTHDFRSVLRSVTQRNNIFTLFNKFDQAKEEGILVEFGSKLNSVFCLMLMASSHWHTFWYRGSLEWGSG